LIGIRTEDCETPLKILKGMPEVLLIKKSRTYHDMIAIVRHDSMMSLSDFIFKKVRAIDCVKDTETTILLEE